MLYPILLMGNGKQSLTKIVTFNTTSNNSENNSVNLNWDSKCKIVRTVKQLQQGVLLIYLIYLPIHFQKFKKLLVNADKFIRVEGLPQSTLMWCMIKFQSNMGLFNEVNDWSVLMILLRFINRLFKTNIIICMWHITYLNYTVGQTKILQTSEKT